MPATGLEPVPVEERPDGMRLEAVQVVELDAIEAELRRRRKNDCEVAVALLPHGVELQSNPGHGDSSPPSTATKWPSSTSTRPSFVVVAPAEARMTGSASPAVVVHFRCSCGTEARSACV